VEGGAWLTGEESPHAVVQVCHLKMERGRGDAGEEELLKPGPESALVGWQEFLVQGTCIRQKWCGASIPIMLSSELGMLCVCGSRVLDPLMVDLKV
jgi:hypothetical protein